MTRCTHTSLLLCAAAAPHLYRAASCSQDEDGEEEMDDELQDETEEEFDGDQTEPE